MSVKIALTFGIQNTMVYWQLYFLNKFGDPNFFLLFLDEYVENFKTRKFQPFFTSGRITNAWFTRVKQTQEQTQEQEKGNCSFFFFLRLCLVHGFTRVNWPGVLPLPLLLLHTCEPHLRKHLNTFVHGIILWLH